MARQRGLLWPLIPPIEIMIATNTQTRFNHRFYHLELAKKVCLGTKARDWISTTQQPDKALLHGSQSPPDLDDRSNKKAHHPPKPPIHSVQSLSRLRSKSTLERVNLERHTQTSASNIDISRNTAKQPRKEWQYLWSPIQAHERLTWWCGVQREQRRTHRPTRRQS